MLNNLKSRLAGKNYYLFRTLIFTLLITGITLAQETTVQLPTMDNTSSFNITKSNDTNVIKIGADGKVGINKTSPSAQLHVGGYEGLLVEGYCGNPFLVNLGSGGWVDPPKGTQLSPGAGTRMHWYPYRSAFRAGNVDGTQWDDENIGFSSTAFGEKTTASGKFSFSIGEEAIASNECSIAMGYETTASGVIATAIGNSTTASGMASTSLGSYTTAGGVGSTAMGSHTTASGNYSTAMGTYNVGITNAIFEIGIGTGSSSKKNAITVENDGDVGIGTTTPQGKLDVNGTIYHRGTELHADYVFKDDYELESIKEHAEFIWSNKHLPAVPKSKKDEHGNDILEMGLHRKGMLEELEKAHMYIEQLNDELLSARAKNHEAFNKIDELNKRLEKLEKLISN